MKRLNNKVAIVTGGASNPGLGHSTIHKFAEEGAKIVAVSYTHLTLPTILLV